MPPCFDHRLEWNAYQHSGGRKSVVAEEAVPGGGGKKGQGQRGSERRGFARGEDGTVLAICDTKEEEKDKQTSVFGCGSTSWRERRRLTENEICFLAAKEQKERKWVTQREKEEEEEGIVSRRTLRLW